MAVEKHLDPLTWNVPIVDKEGRPLPEFIRKWQSQRSINGDFTTLGAEIAAILAKQIIAGTGLTGGGAIGDPGNITLASTITQYTDEMVRDAVAAALVAGTNITIVVDDPGNTITISASGGGGGGGALLPMVNGDTPGPALMSAPDGQTIGVSAADTTILDQLGAVWGDVLYRGATGWVVLAPGSDGRVLTTHDVGANPTWEVAGSGSVLFLPSPLGFWYDALPWSDTSVWAD